MSIPKALSPGEEEFALHLRLNGIAHEREFPAIPGRKWRFDFHISDTQILVEVHGGTRSQGRHNRHQGMSNDFEKMNAALLAGYRVLCFTTEHVRSGYAIDTIMKAMA